MTGSRMPARPALIMAALALLILLLAACQEGGASSSPEIAAGAAMHRANPARTGVYLTSGPETYQSIKWQFEAADWIFGAPAIVDDRVYFTSYDGNAYAADRESGEELWRVETGESIIASPAVAGDMVFVGNMSGTILALDSATGEERWRQDVGSGFSGSPAVVEGSIYFTTENGLLIALDTKTGAEKWRFQQPETAMPFSPAIANGIVYVPVSNGVLYALDAATGEESWRFDPSSARDLFNPTADAVVKDGLVYFMTSNINLVGVLFAIDIDSHELRWQLQTKTENYSPPAVSDDGILIWGSLDGAVYGASAATGEILWSFPTDDIVFTAAAIAGDTVYLGGNDKNLYALDYQTGLLRWQFRAASGVSSPAIDNGVVYVGTVDGALYALQ